MKIKTILCLLTGLSLLITYGQQDSVETKKKKQKRQQVYNYKNKLDIPITAVGAVFSLYNLDKVNNKSRSTAEEILALDPDDINGFDRNAAGNFNENAQSASDFFFYTSIPLPLIIMPLDKRMKKDYGRLVLLYTEAMAFTGIFYTSAQQLNDRYRPQAYNTDLSLERRQRGSNKNSFYSGHVAMVGTSTFFLAKVYHDYYPDSPFRWAFWTTAGLATVLTGHLRMKAGSHFPTDVILGGVMGFAAGVLTPHFHKNKLFKMEGLSFHPVTGQYHGLRLAYEF